jgi:putative protease
VVQLKIPEIRVDNKKVNTANKGERCSIAIEKLIRRSDKVYKIVDADKVKQQ